MAPVSSTQYPHAAVSAMQQQVRQVLSVFAGLSLHAI